MNDEDMEVTFDEARDIQMMREQSQYFEDRSNRLQAQKEEDRKLAEERKKEQLVRRGEYKTVRNKRKMDIALKTGPEWEYALKMFNGTEHGLDCNDNSEVETILTNLHESNPDPMLLPKALK